MRIVLNYDENDVEAENSRRNDGAIPTIVYTDSFDYSPDFMYPNALTHEKGLNPVTVIKS